MISGIKKVCVFILLLSNILTGYCLSDNLMVSILTLEPGIESYTIFGHTAIRIKDTISQTDRIYNFGTFDFDTPHFYWKFLKGDLNYYLSATSFTTYMHGSERDQRKVWEQNLDLEAGEKQRIYHDLERCYLSEDRFYRYNFFHDNCATRVRDAIFNRVNNPVTYDTSLFCCKTFRQLLRPFLARNYWIELGVNLVMGREADKMARPDEFMFLPSYIMYILENSQIAREKRVVLEGSVSGPHHFNFSYVSPWIISAFLITLSFISRTRKIVLYTVATAVGLLGLFLLIVSLISVNSGFCNNYNVAWTIPALFVVLIQNRRLNDGIKILYMAFLVLMMLFRNHLPQSLSVTYLPWIGMLIVVQLMDIQWFMRKVNLQIPRKT
jgi:hypothetical protein